MSQQINLFNPIFLAQKKIFSLKTMVQGLGLILVGCAAFYAWALYEVSDLKQQAADTQKHYVEQQTRLANLTLQYSPERSAQMLQEELERVMARSETQQVLIDTLKSGAVGNTSGYSQYLRAFARQTVQGLWLTGFSIQGDAAYLSLSGGVLNPELLPAYVQRLGKEPVMQGKSFGSLQMQRNEDGGENSPRYIEFSLQSMSTEDVKP